MDNKSDIYFLGDRDPRSGVYSATRASGRGEETRGILLSNQETRVAQGLDPGGNVPIALKTPRHISSREELPARTPLSSPSFGYTIEHCSLYYAPRILQSWSSTGNVRQNLAGSIEAVRQSNYCLAFLLVREYTEYPGAGGRPEIYLTIAIRGTSIILQNSSPYIVIDDTGYWAQPTGYGGDEEEMRLELWFVKRIGVSQYLGMSPYETVTLNGSSALSSYLSEIYLADTKALVDYFYAE